MAPAVAVYAMAIVVTVASGVVVPTWLALAAFVATAACAIRWRLCLVCACGALGTSVASFAVEDGLAHRVTSCTDGVVVELRGDVDGLPKPMPTQVQFDVTPDAIAPWPSCAGLMPRRLRLSWFDAPAVLPGETWQFRVKLRQIRGYQNPGGFDYEAWSFASGIDGGGSVRFGQRIAPPGAWRWDALRSALRARVAAIPLEQPGIVLALLTGDSGLMHERDWALFRSTGTVHLMVISGLHLTIVATIGVALGRGLARLSPRRLARHGSAGLGILCGVLLTTGYSALAGWGVAVLRAWVATAAVFAFVLLARRVSLPISFAWIAAFVLTLDPLGALQAGFWLSFVAVAVLLGYFPPRVPYRAAWRTAVVAQCVMGVAMLPSVAATIGSVALAAPIANLVSVPLVSVVAVPLDLLAGVLLLTDLPGGELALIGVDHVAAVVVGWLEYVGRIGGTVHLGDDRRTTLAVALVASGALLLPLPWRHRAMLAPCIALPLLPTDTAPPHGEFDVTVLDVGQGLAVDAATHGHRLLYDAGPRFPSGFDLGRAVVVPALARQSVERLDAVVLSHPDSDHVGGYPSVTSTIPARALLGGAPVPAASGLRICATGQGWQWDGVRFRVFRATDPSSDNDRSCVLAIDGVHARALLPGDVTRAAEATLLEELTRRPIDVLVAAHHGSRSSSSEAFVARAFPATVVFSAGHDNRFGHPHAEVVHRFAAAGARLFDTARSGALTWRSDTPGDVVEWRAASSPYWRIGADDGSERGRAAAQRSAPTRND